MSLDERLAYVHLDLLLSRKISHSGCTRTLNELLAHAFPVLANSEKFLSNSCTKK